MASEAPGFLGPYRLLNVVHTGQTSQLWQAYHDGKQQRFGIKTLLQRFRADREHVGYLRQEFAVAEKMAHERVLKLHEFGIDRGTPFLASEWFPANNMKFFVQHHIPRLAYLIPKIIEQAAEGLSYFNGLGWVHRDVKPDNFLVTEEGEVKLIDFALAKRITRGGLARLFSPKSKIQGTRSYMSPEQIRGAALDDRADVYSFGCTVFELLAGKPPYTGASADELLMKHLRGPLPSIEAAAQNVTPELAQLIRRCLAKEPSGRPNSVSDFLTEFRMCRPFKNPPRPPEDTPEPEQSSKSTG